MDIAGVIGGAAQIGSSIGGLIGARKDKLHAENSALKSWQRNYDAQKEFAQNSIQWRVQDAKAAGINPYAVISGQTAGYTPQDTSYQTNYQQGVSQAMNGLSDAMGQLQMAAVAEDVKGKKLDNEKKAVELANKAMEARLGQTSATLQQPWFETYTPAIKDTDAHKLRTQTDGSQVFTSSADDVELWNLQAVRDMVDALFGIQAYDDLKVANHNKGNVGLGVFGNAYYPYGVEPSRANVRAADIQRKYGSLAGWLSLPTLHASEILRSIPKGAGKKTHRDNVRNLKSWLGR